MGKKLGHSSLAMIDTICSSGLCVNVKIKVNSNCCSTRGGENKIII